MTPGQHLLARTLVGGLWALIDTVIIFASFIILVMVPEVSAHWPELSEALTKELGMDSNAFFILMFLLNCISAFTGIILIYFCIAVGQLFSKHRILMALLTYLGLTALVSVIVLLTSVLSGTLPILSGSVRRQPDSSRNLILRQNIFFLLRRTLSYSPLCRQ